MGCYKWDVKKAYLDLQKHRAAVQLIALPPENTYRFLLRLCKTMETTVHALLELLYSAEVALQTFLVQTHEHDRDLQLENLSQNTVRAPYHSRSTFNFISLYT